MKNVVFWDIKNTFHLSYRAQPALLLLCNCLHGKSENDTSIIATISSACDVLFDSLV
jgi:hypothetical protein